MIPQIKCQIHIDDDIAFLDISNDPPRKNRSYCLECLNEAQPKKTIQIKKITDQTAQQWSGMAEQIKEDFNPLIDKVQKTIQLLNTLKKKIMTNFDEMISKCQQQLTEYTNNMQKEKECSGNLLKDITGTKLELIAEILSGNHQTESKLEQNIEKTIQLGGEIVVNFKQLIKDEQEVFNNIRQVLFDEITLQSQIKQEQECWVLTCNQEHNMIVGTSGKEIVIWEQNQFKLNEKCVLKGHTDNVTAIVIYQSGDIIVSGGGNNDQSIKLWRKLNNQWNCTQTINDHNDRITDLQLSQNQEQLISASVDKLIKVWRMKQPDYLLECIQTLDDHTHCVYWVTISQDSMFMASSSVENYFNMYVNELTYINPWKKSNKIETKGKIRRVYFTNNDELLVQQEKPPLLIVYSKTNNNQYQSIQNIILNQPDNESILFPMFQIKNRIYLKNGKFVYIIRRLKTGKYCIQQILSLWCRSGCSDQSGQGIVLRNINNNSIDILK